MIMRIINFFVANRSRENIGLILGPVLFLIIVLFPTPKSMVNIITSSSPSSSNLLLSLSPQIALGTMIWMIVWWITECIPLGLTGLIAPFIFVISGILSVRQALSTFSDPIIWIFISGFILAAAFQKWGLDRRIAFSLATFYKGNNPKNAIFFIACLPVFLLTMTGSITASTSIVFPFVMAFMRILNIPVGNRNTTNDEYRRNNTRGFKKRNISNGSGYAEASFLALGQAATAGAMLLLISTAPNLVAKATVEDFIPGKTISFVDWFIIGSPHAIIGLLVSWTVIFLIIKPEIPFLLPAAGEQFRHSLKSMGKITREEKVVLIILISALFLWIVPSLLRSIYPDNNSPSIEGSGIFSTIIDLFKKNISESVPALMIILSVALIRTRKDTQLLKWEEMTKAVDWNIVILFGGGLVLGLGIESSGLASWIGSQISSSLGTHFTSLTIFAISAILGFVLSYAASNTAAAVISCPMAATLATGSGLNPIPAILAAALACSISSSIPSTTPPMAIIYSSKAVRISSMFKTGIISDLIRLAILIAVGPLLIDLILH